MHVAAASDFCDSKYFLCVLMCLCDILSDKSTLGVCFHGSTDGRYGIPFTVLRKALACLQCPLASNASLHKLKYDGALRALSAALSAAHCKHEPQRVVHVCAWRVLVSMYMNLC